jgi:putative ABC transport system substrate-binding protein
VATHGHFYAAFKEALAAQGWKEGEQIVFEDRWAGGKIDRLPALAAELAAKRPSIIVAGQLQAVSAAAKAAQQTPIVMTAASDPVATGLVTSLARPGGMITGLTNIMVDVSEKYLELLCAAVPKLQHVGFLADSNSLARSTYMEAARRSAKQNSIEARFAECGRLRGGPPSACGLRPECVTKPPTGTGTASSTRYRTPRNWSRKSCGRVTWLGGTSST